MQFSDIKTRKVKRASLVTKNELLWQMLGQCVQNQLKFRTVLMDSWFAAKENFEFILSKNKHFVTGLKDNRLMALTLEDKTQDEPFCSEDETFYQGNSTSLC